MPLGPRVEGDKLEIQAPELVSLTQDDSHEAAPTLFGDEPQQSKGKRAAWRRTLELKPKDLRGIVVPGSATGPQKRECVCVCVYLCMCVCVCVLAVAGLWPR